jgi:hypothetical protein
MLFGARAAGSASAVDGDGRPVRVSRPQRRHGAAAARGFATGASLLARVVHLIVTIVVLVIVAGILLALLKANPANTIVLDVHGWARSLAGPFDGMFSFHNARVAIAVNWGIAAVVYVLLGGLIARLLGRPHR